MANDVNERQSMLSYHGGITEQREEVGILKILIENKQERGIERGRQRVQSRLHSVSAEPNVGINVGLELTSCDHHLNQSQTLDCEPPRCPEVPWLLRQGHWPVGAGISVHETQLDPQCRVPLLLGWELLLGWPRQGWHRMKVENAKEVNRKEQIPSLSSSFAVSPSPWYWQDLTRRSRQGRRWGGRIMPQHHTTQGARVGLELRDSSLMSGKLSYHCTNPFICKGLLYKFCILKAISMPHMKNDCDQGLLSLSRHAYKMLHRYAFFKKWDHFAKHKKFHLWAIYVRTM